MPKKPAKTPSKLETSTAPWWKGAVIYQVYPRSFSDSNNDGVGDLPGITEKLEYIASLGVDAIWISPFFTSPMRDFGYDISDYRAVDPLFGKLADFDRLISKAHRLKLRIIIDQVYSHTSDKHPWFIESAASHQNPKSDWYVWADAKRDGTPPNNWLSVFGGSAWQWHTTRQQYYLHDFLSEQPDLNLHSKAVQRELLNTMEFWLKRGVDGFRLDSCNHYFYDKQLRSNPAISLSTTRSVHQTNPYGRQRHVYDKNRPENIAFLSSIRKLLDRYQAVTLAEIGDEKPEVIIAQYTKGGNRLHMAYSFNLLTEEYSARHIREQVRQLYKAAKDAWGCWAVGNHDVARFVTRWGKSAGVRTSGEVNKFSRLCCALLISLRGSVCWYQGDELGLSEALVPYELIQDPVGKVFWPENRGRDGCRTPMPWNAERINAGFSDSPSTWLPIPNEHRERSVDRSEGDPDSPLHTFRLLLKWRKGVEALRSGEIEFIDTPEPVLAFVRREKVIAGVTGAGVLCVFNLGAKAFLVKIAGEYGGCLKGCGVPDAQIGVVVNGAGGKEIKLPPFGVFFGGMS